MWHCNLLLLQWLSAICHILGEFSAGRCTDAHRYETINLLGQMLTKLLNFFNVQSTVLCNNLTVKKIPPHLKSPCDLSLITTPVSDCC